MPFELTILGSSSATPAYDRNPASQFLNIGNTYFLIDCGEATQIQLTKFKIRFHKINHIFISHLHGDHYLGLPGLLSTMHLQGRTEPLNLYSQPELHEMLQLQLQISETTLRFPILFHPLLEGEEKIIYEDPNLIVKTICLSHRIPCSGFLFMEKVSPRKLRKEKIIEYNIPVEFLAEIKNGKNFTAVSGKTIDNKELTTDARQPRSYAYCSDTIYDETLPAKIKNISLLYHEATFLHDLADRAKETYHTTSLQAGMIAAQASVKKLVIGHFSARYKNLEPLLQEARSAFANTFIAVEGEKFCVE